MTTDGMRSLPAMARACLPMRCRCISLAIAAFGHAEIMAAVGPVSSGRPAAQPPTERAGAAVKSRWPMRYVRDVARLIDVSDPDALEQALMQGLT
jgi:hypothetical protein